MTDLSAGAVLFRSGTKILNTAALMSEFAQLYEGQTWARVSEFGLRDDADGRFVVELVLDKQRADVEPKGFGKLIQVFAEGGESLRLSTVLTAAENTDLLVFMTAHNSDYQGDPLIRVEEQNMVGSEDAYQFEVTVLVEHAEVNLESKSFLRLLGLLGVTVPEPQPA